MCFRLRCPKCKMCELIHIVKNCAANPICCNVVHINPYECNRCLDPQVAKEWDKHHDAHLPFWMTMNDSERMNYAKKCVYDRRQ